jgi:ubiquinone/menaquinone biosynthesis C-methylase UbiE
VTEEVRHPLFARLYTRLSRQMDEQGGREHRQRLLAGLAGEVIEVGAGNGLDFAHYPPAVTRVLAVEPEPYLREEARRNAAAAAVPVEVVEGTADALPAPDASFDAAVTSLVLCSVSDPAAALTEIRRVLRPEGELRFFEHVRAERAGMARLQSLLDVTFWPHVAGGCHTGRDTRTAIEQAGFAVEDVEDFSFPETRVTLPTSRHLLGTARLT